LSIGRDVAAALVLGQIEQVAVGSKFDEWDVLSGFDVSSLGFDYRD
jgi:hypothetical protein